MPDPFQIHSRSIEATGFEATGMAMAAQKRASTMPKRGLFVI